MKILLFYFTGTGNTRLCASFLADEFKSKGHDVDLCEGKEIPDIDGYDLLGIGYPIHAFNAPKPFLKAVKALPKASKDYFIFKVSGEPFAINNSSSATLARILRRKGYRKVGEKHFLMPYNIIFRYKDEIAKQMALYLPALCKAYVEDLLEGKAESTKYGFFSRLATFFFKIEYLAPPLNAPFVRFGKRCVKCGQCLRDCPEQAIYLNKKGKYKIHPSKCAMCMRCTLFCPQNAIVFGFMNPWKVNGDFRYGKLLEDESVNPDYINESTKGYFRKFNKYFKKQKALLEAHGIQNPVDAYLDK